MTTVKQAQETQIFFIDYDTMMIGQSSLYDYVVQFESENKQYTRFDEDEGAWYVDIHRINLPTLRGYMSFDTEEEAEDDIFSKILEYDFSKSNGQYFDSEKEAEEEVIDIIQDNGHGGTLDKQVAVSVYNKMKLLYEKRAEKKSIQQAQWSAERAVRNAEIERLLPIEVDSITIDEQFKTALLYASEATGNEKSNRMASAMKGLLQRNNIVEIKSDFWKVLRILKAKAETM